MRKQNISLPLLQIVFVPALRTTYFWLLRSTLRTGIWPLKYRILPYNVVWHFAVSSACGRSPCLLGIPPLAPAPSEGERAGSFALPPSAYFSALLLRRRVECAKPDRNLFPLILPAERCASEIAKPHSFNVYKHIVRMRIWQWSQEGAKREYECFEAEDVRFALKYCIAIYFVIKRGDCIK
jgi:hypothetical protein